MARTSVAAHIQEFRRHGNDIAFVHRRGYRSVRWTYARLAETAARAARELERRGVEKGDRVVIWGEDCGEWVAAFYGCILRGAIAVPLDKVASAEFARRVARDAGAGVAFGSREQLGHLEDSGIAKIPFEDFPAAIGTLSGTPYNSPPLGLSDPVEILFTSGATAEPKGVIITHGNILSNLDPIEKGIAPYLRYERFVHPIRFLSLLPLSHVFGQFMGMFVPGLLGGAVLFAGALTPSDIAQSIRRERVSVLVAVPRMLESLKDHIERGYETRGALSRLRSDMEQLARSPFLRRWLRFRRIHRQLGWKFWAIVSGGAALDAGTEEFWRRLGYVVVQGYGMTETTSLVSLNHPFEVGRGSIGKILPGREMKLDENGEILVRGPSVAREYWRNGEIRTAVAPDGWLHTGDLGEMDAAGNLSFKGRMKNVIVTPEGMNVYPQDIENALRANPNVKDCVVLPLQRGGNAVPGAVLLLRNPLASAAAIVAEANESLAEYQRIRQWFVWPDEDFPRTSTQKPRAAEILKKALPGLSGAATTGSGAVADVVARVAKRPDADLASLSSLERVEVLSALEDRFQVDLNETRFTAATTIKDLEEMVREPAVERTDYPYPRWVQRWPIPWIRQAVYYLLIWPATVILSRPEVTGRERLDELRGPVLVIANHITYFDAGLVLYALPRRLRNLAIAMEGERVRSMRWPPRDLPWPQRMLSRAGYWLATPLFHAFPLPQRAGFRESFRFAGEAVDKGYGVLVFPEGLRTPDGTIQPFRGGIGLLAANLGLPVVPARIHGLWELKISGRRGFAPWGAIRLNIGEPIRLAPEMSPEEITQTLERAVRAL
ncbi:MAG TPA: AMP-binding protein [Terriglobia bacterium]|nr:AMP-binding protein [Terriglobia bacterium]